MPDDKPLPPGSTIGILGGGQLGRMLAVAAAELGLRCRIFCPEPESPAFDVAVEGVVAAYEDVAALDRFASTIDVATVEFENVPSAALTRLAKRVPVRPGPVSLETAQDRLVEKRFVERVGAAVAPYRPIDVAEDLAGWDFAGARAVLKTRRLGYDGKGQATVADHDEALRAFDALGRAPCIIERHVAFRTEISVVAARTVDGRFAAYEPIENAHGRDHVLARSEVPATIAAPTAGQAVAVARSIGDGLGHVGVFAVEFFVVGDRSAETLFVNEIAPRVHNSGHWTQDGAAASQFEQHIRAVVGWPLADPRTLAPTQMTNLVGAAADAWFELAGEPGARLHLYGKQEIRPGRKMGHVNRTLGPAEG